VREHRYTLEMPHDAVRIWALMQDYSRWTEYAPMVLGVEHHPESASRVPGFRAQPPRASSRASVSFSSSSSAGRIAASLPSSISVEANPESTEIV